MKQPHDELAVLERACVHFPDYIVVTIDPCPECEGERLATPAGIEATAERPARTQRWRWCPTCVDLEPARTEQYGRSYWPGGS